MILLTGASGVVGSALLRRLLADGRPVRCLVRDPRELGPERVRVSLVLGDLGDPASFRHAMRGVDCVVHLAGATRDSRGASIEELNGLATLRLFRAAENAGATRFVLLSALGASLHSRVRLLRAKALAEQAVGSASLETTVLACSLVFASGGRWLAGLERLSWLPVVPVPGRGRPVFQPIHADDVAACAIGALDRGVAGRLELAGPETLDRDQIIATYLRARRRRRRVLRVPAPVLRPVLSLAEALGGPGTFATPDEVELLQESLVTPRGTADAERLGVSPRALAEGL